MGLHARLLCLCRLLCRTWGRVCSLDALSGLLCARYLFICDGERWLRLMWVPFEV